MPFKSDKQRRWMYKNKPALARKWQKSYEDGWYVSSDVPSFADGGYVNPTLNMQDGGVVDGFLSKSNPQVERTRYYNEYIKRRNADDEEALSMKFPEWYEKYQGQLEIDGKPIFNFTARELLEFVPVIGDILAAEEVYRELKKDPINWLVVGILTGGTIVGLIPGVGDVAAAAIKKGGRMLKEGSKEALDTIRQYDLEIDPNTLGTAGGNIKIVKKGRPGKTRTIVVQHLDGTTSELTGATAAQSIADATGKPLKTVQNRLAAGKQIVGDDGTVYGEKGVVKNELIDTRESTLGKIEGFDGTFADLMRKYDIDPNSSHANGIRQKMLRSRGWEAPDGQVYKRTDVEALDDKLKRQGDEATARYDRERAIKTITNKRITKARMDKLGLDSTNPDIVNEFSSLWSRIGPEFINKLKNIETPRGWTEEAFRNKAEAEIWQKSKLATDFRKFFKTNAPDQLSRNVSAGQDKSTIRLKLRNLLSSEEVSEIKGRSISDDEIEQAIANNVTKRNELESMKEQYGADFIASLGLR